MVNAFSETMVNGYYKYQPVIVSRSDCAKSEQMFSSASKGYQNPNPTVKLKGSLGTKGTHLDATFQDVLDWKSSF
jgi:hypothetical protein